MRKALEQNGGVIFDIVRVFDGGGSTNWTFTVEAAADADSEAGIQYLLWEEVGVPWNNVERLTADQIAKLDC